MLRLPQIPARKIKGLDAREFWRPVVLMSGLLICLAVAASDSQVRLLFALAAVGFAGGFYLLYRSLYYSAFLDPVVDLSNRARLNRRLEYYFKRYQRKGAMFHLLFVGADNFNKINEVFGHGIGDRTLAQIGRRLKEAGDEFTVKGCPLEVFRFGGGEFAMLVPYHLSDADLHSLVENILSHTDQTYHVGNLQIESKLTFGISTINNKVERPRDMIHFADIARHNATQSMLQFQHYTGAEISSWNRHFLLHQHLCRAIENSEFDLVCQPVYDIHTLKLLGCEMLLRWDSKELGRISPEEFIPVAEASGLISIIGNMVFLTALGHIREWKSLVGEFKVSINVSPAQLTDRYFYNLVLQVLKDNPDLVEHIELEITETAPLVNNRGINNVLLELKAMGLAIALDDYGAGSTSFLNLQQGAFSRIKLDKQLVYDAEQDQTSRKVFQAAVDSAHSLGLSVTVEGVETLNQYDLMRSMGCSIVQGYLFSKPVKPDVFAELLAGMVSASQVLDTARAAGRYPVTPAAIDTREYSAPQSEQ